MKSNIFEKDWHTKEMQTPGAQNNNLFFNVSKEKGGGPV